MLPDVGPDNSPARSLHVSGRLRPISVEGTVIAGASVGGSDGQDLIRHPVDTSASGKGWHWGEPEGSNPPEGWAPTKVELVPPAPRQPDDCFTARLEGEQRL